MSLVPALGWTLGVALLWVAGLPVAARLFPRFPDRGAALALPVSLSVLGVVTFWVGQVRYGYVAPVAGLLAVLATAAVAARAGEGAAVRSCLRRARTPAAVFVLAGGLLLAMRAYDPAVYPWGGEKFLDYGLVRAILRTPRLPPEDIWFSGEPVRYYYGGQLLVATVARLTATPPRFAYNLALATFFGTLATAVYGLAAAVVPDRGRTAGGLAVLFAVLGGHLATPARALSGLLPASLVRDLTPVWVGIRASPADAVGAVRRIVAGGFGYWPERHVIPGVPTAFPMWTYVNGDLRAHMLAAPLVVLAAALALSYYRTPAVERRRRRLLAFGAVPAVAGLLGTVNTWDLPVALGVAWLALVHAPADPASLLPGAAGVAAPRPDRAAPDGGSRGAGESPRAGGIAGAARALAREARRAGVATLAVGVAGALAAALAWPVLARSPPNRGIALVADHSGPLVFALVYGGFLAAFLLAGLVRARPALDARTALTALSVPAAVALSLVDLAGVGIVAPFLLAGWVALRRARARDGVAGRGPGPDADGDTPVADGGDPGGADGRTVGFEALLLVAGAGLVLVGELVYARVWPYDPNAPRWNTMYKLTMGIWLLWGVGAGAALARAKGWVAARAAGAADTDTGTPATRTDGSGSRDGSDPGRGEDRDRDGGPAGREGSSLSAGREGPSLPAAMPTRQSALAVGTVLLVLAAGTFPALAVTVHFGDEERHLGPEPTLDAHAWAREAHPHEMRAIDWLRDRPGTPTVLTRPGRDVYSWRNAPSTFAGLPTVVGWRHEGGYRGLDAYENRTADVDRIYDGDVHRARLLLERYDVDYVYLGPSELARYSTYRVPHIPGLRKVYENERVRIFEVVPYDGPLPITNGTAGAGAVDGWDRDGGPAGGNRTDGPAGTPAPVDRRAVTAVGAVTGTGPAPAPRRGGAG